MIEQLTIALFGVSAIWLSQDTRPHVARWACILGLIAQPAWFYATWKAAQWGMFALCFLYTASWCRGVWTFWLRAK